jgi:hypothetical protein
MPTYADYGGSVISTIAGRFEVTADRHDPMLVLNMLSFNFTDGWNRTFSKHHYARFYA